jgi:hypothetical protein
VIAIASDGQDGKTYHIKESRIIQGTSQLLTLQSLGEEDEEESPDEMEMSQSQRIASNLARILADETPITERVLAVPPGTRQVWVGETPDANASKQNNYKRHSVTFAHITVYISSSRNILQHDFASRLCNLSTDRPRSQLDQ